MSNRNHREGTVLVAVLVCLGLIGILMFSAMHLSLQQRRQLQRELQMEQTSLLAEAGLVRAAKLIESGETKDAVSFRPNLYGKRTSEVKIEFSDSEEGMVATVTAWIGIKDRPELQTRQRLTKTVVKTKGE